MLSILYLITIPKLPPTTHHSSPNPAAASTSSALTRSAPSASNWLQIPFRTLSGQPGWFQYRTLMPFPWTVAIWARRRASCVLLREGPRTGPKLALKSVEAMGETREVMLAEVVARVGMGASQK